MRGTIPAGSSQGVHLLAVYLPHEGIVVAQVAVGTKENEIVAAPRVLATVDLCNKIVVGDAMQTQQKLSIQVVQSGGEYIWYVKDNYPQLRDDIAHVFSATIMRARLQSSGKGFPDGAQGSWVLRRTDIDNQLPAQWLC